LSRAAPPPLDGSQAGFTIIEVLIALAVVAVCIVSIGSVMSTNVRGVRSLEQHVALMQTARSVMATAIPTRAALRPGSSSGQQGDHRWRVDIGQMGADWVVPGAETAWVPLLVKVRVQSPTGGTVDLQTVRMMRWTRQ
jgi:general secretion pathway protein I